VRAGIGGEPKDFEDIATEFTDKTLRKDRINAESKAL
jgi:hypothetical protein